VSVRRMRIAADSTAVPMEPKRSRRSRDFSFIVIDRPLKEYSNDDIIHDRCERSVKKCGEIGENLRKFRQFAGWCAMCTKISRKVRGIFFESAVRKFVKPLAIFPIMVYNI